jgi:divalent metal cation (Fe/Co/Zn/Cd) transporter
MKRSFNYFILIILAVLYILFFSFFDFLSIITVSLVSPILAYTLSFFLYEFIYRKVSNSDAYRKYLDIMVFYIIFIQCIANIFILPINMNTIQFIMSLLAIVISFIFIWQKGKFIKRFNLELILTSLLPPISILILYLR